jgi:hypothetical protein
MMTVSAPELRAIGAPEYPASLQVGTRGQVAPGPPAPELSAIGLFRV